MKEAEKAERIRRHSEVVPYWKTVEQTRVLQPEKEITEEVC